MKKLYFILLTVIMSCSSSDDSVTQTEQLSIKHNWTYTGGTFTGNGLSGITDPYFVGTEFNIDTVINLEYTNGASPFASYILEGNILRSSGSYFFDTGIKNFDGFTINYNSMEMLKDSNNNQIMIEDESFANYTVNLSGNTMQWVKNYQGYEIKYNFTK